MPLGHTSCTLVKFLLVTLFSCCESECGPRHLAGVWRLAVTNPSWKDFAAPPSRFVVEVVTDSRYAVRCIKGKCNDWSVESWSIFQNGSCNLLYGKGRSLSGVLSIKNNCSAVYWGNGSSWYKEVTHLPPSITVHLVPHSHLDPGMSSTASDMYTGHNFSPSIRSLISEVVSAVANESSRTFAPEHAVFHAMWWKDATEHEKALVRHLVSEGRLEWAGGGWVQHDEAITRFEDQVDQTALGKLWLKANTGTQRVSAAWQADTFGHSLSSAYLFALAGHDGYIFGRHMTVGDPINQQSAALWHPMHSFPDSGRPDATTLLTHEQRSGYWNPFRENHNDLINGNITAVRDRLLSYVNNVASTARPSASNIIIMFGDDNQWADAKIIYPALDATIQAINGVSNATGIRMQYSTPSRFFAALHAEGLAFPARPPEWDMVQLIGCEMGAPWVGYYTSRPGLKMLTRAASSLWRAAQKMHALARDQSIWLTHFQKLLQLWEAVSLAQHHDAVTGEEFGVVAQDYTTQLKEGMAKAASVASEALQTLSHLKNSNDTVCLNTTFEPCTNVLNALQSGDDVLVSVYNPMARIRSQFVELLIPAAVAERISVVREAEEKSVPCQTALPWEALDVPGSLKWLVFEAADLPPLGSQRYIIRLHGKGLLTSTCNSSVQKSVDGGKAVLDNGKVVLNFESGMLAAIAEASSNGVSIRANSSVLSYTSFNGTENAWDFSTNGAGYASAKPFPQDAARTVLTTGPLFQELTTLVSKTFGVVTRYRLFRGDEFAHIYVSAGPLNVTQRSQDVILRIDTNIKSGGELYTDSNGLEFVKQVRNHRPWQMGNWTDFYDSYQEVVASNYYPVTLAAVLPTADAQGDSNPALAVLPAGMVGAASLQEGSMELMLNRAVLDGDAADPTSCDNSTGNHKVTQHMILMLRNGHAEKIATTSASVRVVAAEIANPALVFASQWTKRSAGRALEVKMNTPLPPQLELLTLLMLPPSMNVSFESPDGQQPSIHSSVYLLRIRHMFAAGDGGLRSNLGLPVTLDLRNAFEPFFRIKKATEMTIDGMQSAADAAASRLQWKQASAVGHVDGTVPSTPPSTIFTIAPMEIRTWHIELDSTEVDAMEKVIV